MEKPGRSAKGMVQYARHSATAAGFKLTAVAL